MKAKLQGDQNQLQFCAYLPTCIHCCSCLGWMETVWWWARWASLMWASICVEQRTWPGPGRALPSPWGSTVRWSQYYFESQSSHQKKFLWPINYKLLTLCTEADIWHYYRGALLHPTAGPGAGGAGGRGPGAGVSARRGPCTCPHLAQTRAARTPWQGQSQVRGQE